MIDEDQRPLIHDEYQEKTAKGFKSKLYYHPKIQKCKGFRILVIVFCIAFCTYLYFSIGDFAHKPEFIVNVPPIEMSLYGTKGMATCLTIDIYLVISEINFRLVPKGFLVWSPDCKIPSFNPLANDVMKYIDTQKYAECSTKKPLTMILKNGTNNEEVYLLIDENEIMPFYYKREELNCCWQEIQRAGERDESDIKFK